MDLAADDGAEEMGMDLLEDGSGGEWARSDDSLLDVSDSKAKGVAAE